MSLRYVLYRNYRYVLYRNYRYAKVSMGETANPTNPRLGLGPSTPVNMEN